MQSIPDYIGPLQNDVSFSRFKDLPNEIRDMIWRMAVEDIEPQFVYLRQSIKPYGRVWSNKSIRATMGNGIPAFFERGDDDQDLGSIVDRGGYKYFTTACHTPALLHACRESRYLVSRFYSKAFRTTKASPYIWFSFPKDTLFLDWGWASGQPFSPDDLNVKEMQRVRRLALPDREGPQGFFTRLYDILATFRNVQKLIVIRGRLDETKENSGILFQPARTDTSSACLRTLYDPVLLGFDRYAWGRGAYLRAGHEAAYARRASFCDRGVRWATVSRIESYREDWIRDGRPWWRMPRVDFRILTTATLKARLEDADGPFENRKDLNWRHDWNSSIPNDRTRVRWICNLPDGVRSAEVAEA